MAASVLEENRNAHQSRRELDIEDVAVIPAVLAEARADGPAFAAQAHAVRDEAAATS